MHDQQQKLFKLNFSNMIWILAFNIFIILSLFCYEESRASPSLLEIKWLHNDFATKERAVCNDGSPSAYYFSLSSCSSNKWLIHLQGGGQCYSKQTCDERFASAPQLMSSKTFSSTVTLSGLFDDEVSKSTDYHDANKVFIPYCTSDGWMGDAPASDITWGYEFRGQKVIRAAILDLVSSGLLTSDAKILFGGSSAGARGAMVNVDTLPALLPGGPSSLVGVFLDSPYYIDVLPYSNSGFVGFQNQTKEIYNRYNVGGIISDECQQAFPLPEDKWKCLYGQYRMQFLKTNYLLIASQFDSYQLSSNLGANPPYSSSNMYAYAQQFADITRSHLVSLFSTIAPSSSSSILSWSCYTHAVSLSSKFYQATCSSETQVISMNNATTHLVNLPTPSQLWLEQCASSTVGVSCGTNC